MAEKTRSAYEVLRDCKNLLESIDSDLTGMCWDDARELSNGIGRDLCKEIDEILYYGFVEK